MKKLIILLLIMLLTSCNNTIVTNVYDKQYIEPTEAIYDMNLLLERYDFYVVPLDEWIHNKLSVDTLSIEQYIIKKDINRNSQYIFIFSTYKYPSITYNTILVRFNGRKKDLK